MLTDTPSANAPAVTDAAAPAAPAAAQAPAERQLNPLEKAFLAADQALAAKTAEGTAAPVEGETPAEGTAPAPDAAASAAAAPTEGEAPAAPDLTVKLPARRAGEAEVEFKAETPEQAEALRRAVNGALRKEDYTAKAASLAKERAEIQQLTSQLETDPSGFVVDRLPDDVQLGIAEQLVAKHFETLRPMIEAFYGDDTERRAAALKHEEARIAQKRTAEASQTVRERSIAIRSAVEALIPEDAPQSEGDDFFLDSVNYIAAQAQRGPVRPEDVPRLLESRLRRYGFAPSGAAGSAPPVTGAPAPTAAAAKAPAAPPAPAQRPAAIATARAAASAAAPVGAGAAPATAVTRPPKGFTIEQAADWAMQNIKRRA